MKFAKQSLVNMENLSLMHREIFSEVMKLLNMLAHLVHLVKEKPFKMLLEE